jgi:hypothetical protein
MKNSSFQVLESKLSMSKVHQKNGLNSVLKKLIVKIDYPSSQCCIDITKTIAGRRQTLKDVRKKFLTLLYYLLFSK